MQFKMKKSTNAFDCPYVVIIHSVESKISYISTLKGECIVSIMTSICIDLQAFISTSGIKYINM